MSARAKAAGEGTVAATDLRGRGTERSGLAREPEGLASERVESEAGEAGMEPRGIEPLTFWLPARRSPS